MKSHRTLNDMKSNAKKVSIEILNTRLADSIDLALLTKRRRLIPLSQVATRCRGGIRLFSGAFRSSDAPRSCPANQLPEKVSGRRQLRRVSV